jgi:hypothetical protein
MKNIINKSLILIVISLFLTVCFSPAFAQENYEINDENIDFEYSVIGSDGLESFQKISITETEFKNLRNEITIIINKLKSQTNDEEIVNILKSYLNVNKYPILSRIFSRLLDFDFIGRRKLVVSQGIGPDFSPFKDSNTALFKPFTSWMYLDSNNLLPMPSGTGVLSLNPFKIKTFVGPQFGFMLRFRGIYVNIGQPTSMQSYTFFIGTARYVGGFEFTPISSIF